MGTRSTTKIYGDNNELLVTLYKQFDGDYSSYGKELQDFLKNMAIVNGYGSSTPAKAANGMGCLAASLIAHFKAGIGGFYVTDSSDTEEYNYEIRQIGNPEWNKPAKVSLVGRSEHRAKKVFPLYDEILPTNILKRVQFLYQKETGFRVDSVPTRRTVDVIKETPTYIEGFEDGAFKKFLKNKIVDGWIVEIPLK